MLTDDGNYKCVLTPDGRYFVRYSTLRVQGQVLFGGG